MRKTMYCIMWILIFTNQIHAHDVDDCFRLQSTENSKTVSIEKSIENAKEGFTLTPFGDIEELYALSVNMELNSIEEDYVVRVVLVDASGKKHLVAEFFKELFPAKKPIIIDDYCEETGFLAGIKPTKLIVYANKAEVTLHSIIVTTKDTSGISADPQKFKVQSGLLHDQQAKAKVESINSYIRNNNKLWMAGLTALSQKSFEEKMRLLGCPYSGNTYGLEYYMGGIIDIGNVQGSTNLLSNSSSFVDEFDWRNRHGKNWMTPVKDQGNSKYCSAFTAVSCAESLVNLYLNDLVNLDLSEQEAACCYNSSINYYNRGMPILAPIEFMMDNGVCDEVSFPFVDDPLAQFCYSDQIVPQYIVTMGGYSEISNSNIDGIKNALIHNGPLATSIRTTDGINHAMALVGYGKIKEGDIVQHIWNYSGSNTGLTDTLHIEANNPLIGKDYWIFKNSYVEGGTANPPYMLVTIDLPTSLGNAYTLYNPIWEQRSSSGSYVTMNNVICEDSDGDGLYFWGLGPKPSTASASVPDEADGDDSDPLLGTLDQFGYCEDLNPETRPVEVISSNQTTTDTQRQYSHIEVNSNATWTVAHDRFFYNGAKIIIRNGSSLVLSNGALLDNVEIVMESGATLRVTGNSKIRMRSGMNLNAPLGASVIIESGEIL